MKCLLCQTSFENRITLKNLMFGSQLTIDSCCLKCFSGFSKIDLKDVSRCQMCLKKIEECCGDCDYWKKLYQTANYHHALFDYNDSMKHYMKVFKFEGNIKLSEVFNQEISQFFSSCSYDLVVPIPLSKKRLKIRGFNQVEEILKASEISYTDLLMKKKHTKSQSKSSRQERLISYHAFQVKKGKYPDIKGKKLVLVDDIYTTGSTIYQARQVLLTAGAKEVITLTLAR